MRLSGRQRIYNLWESGKTAREIYDEVEHTIDLQYIRNTLSYWKRDHGETPPPKVEDQHPGNPLHRYKLAPEAGLYEQVVTTQNGRCAVCERAEGPGGQRFCLDYDWTTRTYHAVLCLRCAVVLTRSGRDPIRLRKALEYLEKTESAHENSEW